MSDFLPVDFENRMKALLGEDFDSFVASYDMDRKRGLRANLIKYDNNGEDALSFLSKESVLSKIPWTDCGFFYEENMHPGKHPYHEAGMYYIQEPSAMIPGMLIDARPGEKVLDLCAAPGGKTTQIASQMMGWGLLVSNEINASRAKILAENVERMGIKNAIVTNETSGSLAKRFEGYFDKIMVDAPCSGEGMFRKNDEAINEWSVANVKMCAERQAEILDNAATMLKAGGTICYSTCTFAPEENELGIKAFLDRHDDFELIDSSWIRERIGEVQRLDIDSFGIDEEVMEKTIRIWPHRTNGEGHFAAVLVKKENGAEIANAEVPPMSAADKKKVIEYLGDILKPECFEDGGLLSTGRLEFFGENVYLVPGEITSLKGLKVMRAGLHLGMIAKNRFEPAHALALALRPGEALRSVSFDDKEAADYIKGLTKNTYGEKGWTLVCVDGFSLGWGKNAGGILKNHYPKGLRKG